MSCKTLLDLLSFCKDNKIEKRLYQETIHILGSRSFSFHPPKSDVTTLICGSVTFLNEKYLIFGKKKAIYITDEHKIFRRKIPQGLMNLTRIKHTSVGGATTYEGLYAYSGIKVTPKLSCLQRQVGDFIDYGIPPSTTLPQHQFVSHKSLMPVTRLESLVQYPTHFSLNGIGYRTLMPKELAKLFGVSTIVYQITLHKAMFPIVPVQILDALLSGVLLTPLQPGSMLNQMEPPAINNPKEYALLPGLDLHLSDSWSKVMSSKEVVATDDSADINQSIWDQRIILAFPKISVPVLDWFRRQILRKHFYRVFVSFKTYILNTYPALWEQFVTNRKHLEATAPVGFNGGDLVCLKTRKRKRKGTTFNA